jgi:hypothetical protein
LLAREIDPSLEEGVYAGLVTNLATAELPDEAVSHEDVLAAGAAASQDGKVAS